MQQIFKYRLNMCMIKIESMVSNSGIYQPVLNNVVQSHDIWGINK